MYKDVLFIEHLLYATYISMEHNLTWSTFVYGNLIYMQLTKASMCEWYVVSKVMQCKVMQHYAKSCNITQGHAKSRKVMQGHAK